MLGSRLLFCLLVVCCWFVDVDVDVDVDIRFLRFDYGMGMMKVLVSFYYASFI